jgi:hypothetical protein
MPLARAQPVHSRLPVLSVNSNMCYQDPLFDSKRIAAGTVTELKDICHRLSGRQRGGVPEGGRAEAGREGGKRGVQAPGKVIVRACGPAIAGGAAGGRYDPAVGEALRRCPCGDPRRPAVQAVFLATGGHPGRARRQRPRGQPGPGLRSRSAGRPDMRPPASSRHRASDEPPYTRCPATPTAPSGSPHHSSALMSAHAYSTNNSGHPPRRSLVQTRTGLTRLPVAARRFGCGRHRLLRRRREPGPQKGHDRQQRRCH